MTRSLVPGLALGAVYVVAFVVIGLALGFAEPYRVHVVVLGLACATGFIVGRDA